MHRLLNLVYRHWLALTLLLLSAITILSLSPLPQLPEVPGSDKTHHLIAYAALVFPLAWRQPRFWPGLILLMLGWSGAIELIQPYVNRYGEWLDLAANGGGLLCGLGLALLLRRLLRPTTEHKL
ncbi:VanZ family protein [Motiliproteus coralliicola]|uniref:VanZ family protein n=1 Tax=Motiliproteus coralliicola TaxID=2283196 RepID=A0A369WAM7_9GAMM|nr:VanZ family protein [Motiliproteus coralliicola]